MNQKKKRIDSPLIVFLTLLGSCFFICRAGTVLAASCPADEGKYCSRIRPADSLICDRNQHDGSDTLASFKVVLPSQQLPMPTPLTGDEKGFTIRGMKGYCWTPRQYLEEIPVLAKYKANFLMNCYLSMFSVKDTPVYHFGTFLDSLENNWWQPLPDKKRLAYEQVFRECRKFHIDFCFAMNPQLFSKRPLDPDSGNDFDELWKHYAWAQQQGVRWFSVCLDDVQEGDVAIVGADHARFANKLLNRLRSKDPGAQLIFCPTWYWGTGTDTKHRVYLEELANMLHPDIYVFWTGPQVVPVAIHTDEAVAFRQLVRHRLILWENYPVNDNHPTLHLGPVTGRDKDLNTVIDGYMVNPMGTQNQINRIPLLTCLDYAYNPEEYDPVRSIGQSILHLASTLPQQKILARMVETYPGSLILRRNSSDNGLVSLNPVRQGIEKALQTHKPAKDIDTSIADYERFVNEFDQTFPGRFSSAKISLRNDLHWGKQLRYEHYGYKSDTVRHVLLLDPSADNPRNSEGDFIRLKDGRILFVYSHFTGGSDDFDHAYLAGRYSDDGGQTWSKEDAIILPNEGKTNIMSVSLLRLKNNSIALFYLRKNSGMDCRLYMRVSKDEARTWSKPVCIEKDQVGYYVANNDRVVQLASGRLIVPVALHNTPTQKKMDNYGEIMCYLSDNNGKKWHRSSGTLNNKKVMLQEPGIVELSDERLMLFCRTNAGFQYQSFSSDYGDTWSEMKPSNIPSFMSPATIERIPSTGDLLLVWNYRSEDQHDFTGKRTPLCTAVSFDEGKTWTNRKILESNPKGWYCYTAIDFTDGHILLGYCAGIREKGMNGLQTLQVTRLPVEWLYQNSNTDRRE